MQHRDEERGGLTGARPGHGHHVGARERDRNRLALDGGGYAVALALDRPEHLGQDIHRLKPAALALSLLRFATAARQRLGALEAEVHRLAALPRSASEYRGLCLGAAAALVVIAAAAGLLLAPGLFLALHLASVVVRSPHEPCRVPPTVMKKRRRWELFSNRRHWYRRQTEESHHATPRASRRC